MHTSLPLIDCGAGIGRVTKLLLLKRFARVDMVEQSPRLLNAAPAYIGPDCERAKPLLIGLQVNTVHTQNAEGKKIVLTDLFTFHSGTT